MSLVNIALVRDRRKDLGLTQADLAEEIGVSVETVVNWETGHCEPGLTNGLAWARTLGILPESLLSFAAELPKLPIALVDVAYLATNLETGVSREVVVSLRREVAS